MTQLCLRGSFKLKLYLKNSKGYTAQAFLNGSNLPQWYNQRRQYLSPFRMTQGNGVKFAFKLCEYTQLHLKRLRWCPSGGLWGQMFSSQQSAGCLTCTEGRIQCLLSPPPLWTAGHSPERPPLRGQTYCPRRTSSHLSSTEVVPEQTRDKKK